MAQLQQRPDKLDRVIDDIKHLGTLTPRIVSEGSKAAEMLVPDTVGERSAPIKRKVISIS